MNKCKKCNVYVDAPGNICPLCKSVLEKDNTNSTYPVIKNKLSKDFVRKVLLFIVACISLVVLVLNQLLTPNIRWAGFVVAAMVSTYLVFRSIMTGRNNVLRLMFTLDFLVIILAIFWDYYTGYRGWSLNYVLPTLCISYGMFLIVLRIVSYFAFRENSTYIYINVFLEFLPLVLLYMGKVTFVPLAVISGILGIANLLILLVFDGSKFKSDLEKKLHI